MSAYQVSSHVFMHSLCLQLPGTLLSLQHNSAWTHYLGLKFHATVDAKYSMRCSVVLCGVILFIFQLRLWRNIFWGTPNDLLTLNKFESLVK